MCGIAGIVSLKGTSVERAAVQGMVDVMRHRGPDGAGVYTDGGVGLGHARLSVIDLATGGQPMLEHDRSACVTYNGEIYNYVELGEDLARKGERLNTRSDTAVLLRLYRTVGEDCVRALNGQWAFAIWDRRRRKLFLSRDRMGVRPLYYTTVDGWFLFASEVKALFAHPSVPREIDPRGLDQVFTFWCPVAPRTAFRGVNELPPGHSLVVEDGQVRVYRHWHPSYPLRFEPTSEAAAAEELRAVLGEATRLRLRADVPVGAYLSGGLDSALVTALARRTGKEDIETFSIRFADAGLDEGEFQEKAVARLGTKHHAVTCTDEDIARAFPEVVAHAEAPLVRSGPVPMFLLSRQVRDRGYKVVLTGEGSDELFGGYDLFKEAGVRRFWAAQPDSPWRPQLLRRLYPYVGALRGQSVAYLGAFFQVSGNDLADPLFSHQPRIRLTSMIKSFYSPQLRRALAGFDACAELRDALPEDFARWHPLCRAQYLETTVLLPGYLLSSQGDRMAMAHGVEGRFPFLDHRVVELAARMPPTQKLRALREKRAVKRCASGLVPDELIRRPKQPFRAPDAASFIRTGRPLPDYVERLLAPEAVRRFGLFDPDRVSELRRKAEAGRPLGTKDNMAVMGILSTQLLAEQFVLSQKGNSHAWIA